MVGVPFRPAPRTSEKMWTDVLAEGLRSDAQRFTDMLGGMVNGMMSPGRALAGEYDQLQLLPDGRVSPFDPRMVDDAASLAGMVTLGSGALPGEVGALRMGAKFLGDKPPDGFPVQPGQKFDTIRNTEGAKNFAGNAEWMKLDPHGTWMSHDIIPEKSVPDARWVKGSATLEKPLYINQDNGRWKQRLSDQYDGATGEKLTDALKKDGYDGIVTFDKYGASEIVQLSGTASPKSKLST